MRSGRHTSGKYSQPYLPIQEGSLQLQSGGGEFLFQPIAEDEPGLDELEAIMGGAGQADSAVAAAQGAVGAASVADETQWQTLPSYMQQSCRLERAESPPPPAPEAPPPPQVTPGFRTPPPARKRSDSENMDTLSPT